jgi:hypothetical protein
VRWDAGGTEPADDYTYVEMGTQVITWGQTLWYIRVLLAVKRVEFVSDRMLYIL